MKIPELSTKADLLKGKILMMTVKPSEGINNHENSEEENGQQMDNT
ncbi:hypothetical protein [Chryseobacterium indologenes]|nr:hypothetical protein [Chryseobacterium indologenes]